MPDSPPHYPVRLTQAQRKALAEIAPELADRLNLDEPDQRTMPFTVAELKVIRKQAAASACHASTGMKRNSFRHVADLTTQALDRSQGIGAIQVTERLYQFKITLKDIAPAIWRRIQVKDCTLKKLHEHIQTAMGWTNSHLYGFKINDQEYGYGDPHLLDDEFANGEFEDSTGTKLTDILPRSGKRLRFEYEYDFGDSWHHEVVFEGCLRAERGGRYPVCVEGKRACPLEDVGGTSGYEEYLEAMADPDHERHDEFMGWRGPFDPEAFDPAKATKAMRRVKQRTTNSATTGDDSTQMNPKRITIIPCIHGKLTRDGKMSEPDIYWIMEKWLERHPDIKTRTQDILVSRGTMTLPHGGKTDLIRATIIVGEDIEGYDPAQDLDLYEYFLSDDQGDREPPQRS